MVNNKELICRLCLKRCGCSFEVIEDTMRDIFKILMLDLDLKISSRSMVCYTCLDSLIQCFDTKADHVQKNDAIIGMNVVSGSSNMCRLCIQPINKGKPRIFLNKAENVADMLEKHFVLATNGTQGSLLCMPCYESLQRHCTFLSNCLAVENDVRNFCEMKGADKIGQIELTDVLSFVAENTYENTLSCSEVKLVKYSQVETCGESSVETEESQITIDCKNIKTEFEQNHRDRSENGTEQDTKIDTTKSSAQTSHKCDRSTSQSFCKDNLRRHVRTRKNASEVATYKCETCPFQGKRKQSLQQHMLSHKSVAEIRMYKCTVCAFQTKYRSNIPHHMLRHRSTSEGKRFKCDMCPYQSNYKGSLGVHMLVHKSTSETEMYKCEICSFQTKRRGYLRTHMYIHKFSFSGVTMFKCDK